MIRRPDRRVLRHRARPPAPEAPTEARHPFALIVPTVDFMSPLDRVAFLLPFFLLFGSVWTPAASAQECPRGRISYVYIDNHSIFDTTEMEEDAPFLWAYELANSLHIDTRQAFLRDELLFEAGDCFDPLLLQESERVLRSYEFIARVDVFGVPQPDGSHHVVVDTQDEWTTKVNLGLAFEGGIRLESASIEEENFLGRGVVAGVFFRERRERRDLGMVFQTPRLFSTRWDASFSAGRTRVGTFLAQGFEYPFVAEVSRTAARQVYRRREVLFPYSVPDGSGFTHVLLPFEREALEVTGAARIGEPGNLTVFGLGILRETMSFAGYPGNVEVALDGDFSDTETAGPAAVAAVSHQAIPTTIFRLNFLLGQRNIRFVQRTGLDALAGVQDVRLGTEVSATVGRALGDVGSGRRDAPDDLYLRFHSFGGWAPGRWILATSADVEARLVFQDAPAGNTFRDVLADADVYAYWKPGSDSGHTLFGRISGAGGWSVRRPFQMTLGGRTGLRGYDEADFPGARRVLVSLEDRIHVKWPAPDLFDFGIGLFADAGRIWGGDVPFGSTTAWHTSVGGGLRVGFPPGTRTVARFDIALPLTGPEAYSRPIFRVSLNEILGIGPGFDDEELRRSRRPSVGTDLLATERR